VSATFEEPAAPEPQTEPRFDIRAFLLRRLMRFGMFCVWYVLSIGPMFWIWHHAHLSNQPSLVETFYMPLAIACQVLPWFRDLVNAYINWWIL
jgi:hypothetical protein